VTATPRAQTALGLLALASNVVGSLLIAINTGVAAVGYAFFIAGVVPATYLLLISNANRTLILTNVYFFGVNILGIFRHWSS
jgi:hypothetical protein